MSFSHPALWIVSGASQSGKSNWCCRFVKHSSTLFQHTFDKIIWCYYGNEEAVPRSRLSEFDVIFHKGLPSDFSKFPTNSLIIIDDCQQEAVNSQAVLNLFTRGSHHDKQTVCLVVQNLFAGGKNQRSLALNTHVYVLFRAIRDKAQASTFFRQISPAYWRDLTHLYEQSTQKQYSYFVVDCHPATANPCLRFRTHIFPDDKAQIVYCLPADATAGEHGWKEERVQGTGPLAKTLVLTARS